MNRLTYACSDWDPGTGACLGESFGYTYDGAGNALSFSRWSGSGVETVSFIYNRANQILCQDGNANGLCGDPGDVPYTYDAYGNLTDDGVKTYVYDAENRLVSASDGVSTTSYGYNGDGDRISQTVDGILTSYVLDTASPLTMVLAETTGTESIYYLHGVDLVSQSDGVCTEYFAYDGLGSVRQVLDEMGEVLFAQIYDPYGNPFDSAGMNSTSFGFTGEQEDGNGLIYLRARYYQPNQGRFLQRDLWRGNPNKPNSLNPWLYVEGNPITFTDPSGEFPLPPRGWKPPPDELCKRNYLPYCELLFPCQDPKTSDPYFDEMLGLLQPIYDWGSPENQTNEGRKYRAETVLSWMTIYKGSGAWWKSGNKLNVQYIKAWILDGEAGELWLLTNFGNQPNPTGLQAEFINSFLGDGPQLLPEKLANFTNFFNPVIFPRNPEGAEFNFSDWNRVLTPPAPLAIERIMDPEWQQEPPRVKRWWREGEAGTEDRIPLYKYKLPNGDAFYFD